MLMKSSISLLFLLLTATANAQSLSYQFNHLSAKQITVLKQACRQGIADNLCLSLAAIAWQESDFGKYNINLQDPSAGWYHIRIRTALARITPHIRNTAFNRNRVAQWLINDPNLAGSLAIAELKYWLHYWHGNYFKAWGSYNGGYKGNRRYARAIAAKVMFLKKHLIY